MKILLTTIIGLILLATIVYAQTFEINYPTQANPINVLGGENITLLLNYTGATYNVDVIYMIINTSNICFKSDTQPIFDISLGGMWRFNGDATDEEGGHDAIAYNESYGIGRYNQTITFNGNNSYAIVPNVSFLENQQFTIETWARRNGEGFGGLGQAIISKGLNEGFIIYYSPILTNWIFGVYNGTWNFIQSNPNTAVVGEWFYFAMTYDAITGNFSSYINGQLNSSMIVSGVIIYSGLPIEFGRFDDRTPLPDYFNGSVDSAQIQLGAMPSVIIADRYNARRFNNTDGLWYQNCTTPSGLFGSHNLTAQIYDMTSSVYHTASEHNAVIYPTLEEMKYISELLIIVFVVLVFFAVKLS